MGNGHAKKDQVQYMMSIILSLPDVIEEDAADALACAVTHANFADVSGSKNSKLPEGVRTSRRGGRYGR